MLRELMLNHAEVRGLYALLLVTDARRATRIDADGRLVQLKERDRSLWDRSRSPTRATSGPSRNCSAMFTMTRRGSW